MVKGSEPKTFREGGRPHQNVRIYLEADESTDLEQIEMVRYELYPTFRERLRVSNDPTKQFEIRIWTYGYFQILAGLYMQDGARQEIKGMVKW